MVEWVVYLVFVEMVRRFVGFDFELEFVVISYLGEFD